MRYIVEVAIEAGKLAHELSQMRTWLDHMKFHAIRFKQIPGTNVYRVDFEDEGEARTFAQTFACQVPIALSLGNIGVDEPPTPAQAGKPVEPDATPSGGTVNVS